MKSIKVLLLAVLISATNVLSAGTKPVKKVEPTVITQEVGKLLKNPSFEVSKDILANVTLAVNKNNEIVVLSVDSESDMVKNYIKSRLNYNKLEGKVISKTYKVPVRITLKES